MNRWIVAALGCAVSSAVAVPGRGAHGAVRLGPGYLGNRCTVGAAVTTDPGIGAVYTFTRTGCTTESTDLIAYSSSGVHQWTADSGGTSDVALQVTVDPASHTILTAAWRYRVEGCRDQGRSRPRSGVRRRHHAEGRLDRVAHDRLPRMRCVMRTLTICGVLLLAYVGGLGPAAAGAQQVWMHTYPGVGACGLEAVSTAVDPGTGAVYAAYHDFECGPNAGLLVAYTSTGTKKWAVENTSFDDLPVGVAVDPATHTVLLASTRNDSEMLVQAFNTDGHKLWGKALLAGGSDNFDTIGLVVDAQGRVVVSGTVTHAGVPSFSTAAFKVATGATVWHVHYNGGESLGATAVGIAVDPGLNRAYIVGTAFRGDGENLVTVAYGTATGNVAWTKEVSVGTDGANAVPTGIAVDSGNHQVYSLTATRTSPRPTPTPTPARARSSGSGSTPVSACCRTSSLWTPRTIRSTSRQAVDRTSGRR